MLNAPRIGRVLGNEVEMMGGDAQDMTLKERMLKVLSGQRPDMIPVAPSYLDLTFEDSIREYYVDQYKQRMKELKLRRYQVDHIEDTIFRVNAIYHVYSAVKEKSDWIQISYCGPSRRWAESTEIYLIDDNLFYVDKQTGEKRNMLTTELPSGIGYCSIYGGCEYQDDTKDIWDSSSNLRTAADVDALIMITPAEELLDQGILDVPRRIVSDYGDKYYISALLGTPFTNCYDLIGFRGMMVMTYENPELLKYIIERELAQDLERAKALAQVGIDGIYVVETFTGGDMISPQAYNEFIYPFDDILIREIRRLGLRSIFYFCGDINPRLDRLAKLDIAALAFEESKGGVMIELERIVDKVGKDLCLLGNIDSIRFGLHGTPEEMVAEVKRQIDIGSRAAGFIVSNGSPFPPDTNPRQIDAMITAAHEHKIS